MLVNRLSQNYCRLTLEKKSTPRQTAAKQASPKPGGQGIQLCCNALLSGKWSAKSPFERGNGFRKPRQETLAPSPPKKGQGERERNGQCRLVMDL